MPAQKPLIARDLIRAAAKRLKAAKLVYGHGTAGPEDEALFIAAESLKLSPFAVETWEQKRVTARQAAAVDALVAARIKTRKPAAYLLKKMYLQGIPFYVDARVIVPRSFIAEILGEGLSLIDETKIKSVLDLCTGSGCLAVLAAYLFPKAKIDAVELSPGACKVAARNIKDSGFEKRIKLHKGDLFQPVRGKKYDLIITNPPYVAPRSMKKLPKEYLHEPAMALAGGGADGMEIVARILKEAPRHLTDNGGLICEIGGGQAALEAAHALPFLWLDTENSRGEVFWLERKDFN